LGCILYGFLIEANWIEVTRHEVTASVSRPIKIAHLTDLHIRSVRYREKKLLQLLEAEKPDLIVVTGDSVSDNEDYIPVDQVLKQLRAPLGVWVIEGNWDRWHPRPVTSPARDQGDLHFLNNASRRVSPEIELFGFVDGLIGVADPTLVRKENDHLFRIALIHSPADFDRIFSHFDLVFGGHTHGGQIRLPFLKPVYLPNGSGSYVAGWYEKSNSKMYVSRGIGNSLIEARFLCRPELAILTLIPAH
jgi:predicted MPP superfamily phosphohydrolase